MCALISSPSRCGWRDPARRDLLAEHGFGLRGMLFIEAVVRVDNAGFGLNYGFERIRFTAVAGSSGLMSFTTKALTRAVSGPEAMCIPIMPPREVPNHAA